MCLVCMGKGLVLLNQDCNGITYEVGYHCICEKGNSYKYASNDSGCLIAPINVALNPEQLESLKQENSKEIEKYKKHSGEKLAERAKEKVTDMAKREVKNKNYTERYENMEVVV